MNRNLVGSTYGRFCIKFPQIRMKGEQHRVSRLSLYSNLIFKVTLFCTLINQECVSVTHITVSKRMLAGNMNLRRIYKFDLCQEFQENSFRNVYLQQKFPRAELITLYIIWDIYACTCTCVHTNYFLVNFWKANMYFFFFSFKQFQEEVVYIKKAHIFVILVHGRNLKWMVFTYHIE